MTCLLLTAQSAVLLKGKAHAIFAATSVGAEFATQSP
jgi:hypothetical protein